MDKTIYVVHIRVSFGGREYSAVFFSREMARQWIEHVITHTEMDFQRDIDVPWITVMLKEYGY